LLFLKEQIKDIIIIVLEIVSAAPDTPWSWDLDELWRTKRNKRKKQAA